MKLSFRNTVICSLVLTGFVLINSAVSAASFTQVKATWSGDGKEPSVKEFADLACVNRGLTSAVDFDKTPTSGAYEEDGNIVSFMEFSKLECK